MHQKRVTLADVAKAAGVSRTTASLVLSDRGDELRISEPVQQRVRQVAAELAYRPNAASQVLRTGLSRTFGFISDTVATSQLAGDMIKGALEGARRHDHMLFIGESEGSEDEQARLIQAMVDRQVDGIVIASMFTRERPVPSGVGRPLVFLNTVPAEPRAQVPVVIPDEIGAGRAAARALLDAGHRKIHLIGAGPTLDDVPPLTIAGRERLEGILQELGGAGLEPASGRRCGIWLPEDGWRATAALLRSGVADGAILCFNDRLALGAYQAIQEAGFRVPQDFSVVSFDDHQLAGWLRPGLTTVALPHYELGRRAIDALLAPAAAAAGVERVPMPLRARGSIAAPGAAADAH
ncbi:LacI family DNA-binding transcriptional regulator [Glycomyces artemisiae]|uniref:LacI family transcriptional regulator n=1 Tax=Glycomyces artemisiae TaxID=1076443 RepID=A0A2T0UL49_9ACTN|nr:LacI family DNA-binding transcriptional regulator [Glycomyces artemisiae]PRY58659.1 LacI family transcriptional regulator [Glycomyces artemisiae]